MGMNIKAISRLTSGALWVSFVGVGAIQALVQNPPFDPKPAIFFLPPISTAVTVLFREYSHRLEKEEFSTSDALAAGYLTNFLRPVITGLVKARQAGGPQPRIAVYIPKGLEQTKPDFGERLTARIREKNFSTKNTPIEVAEGRPRNVLALYEGEKLYAYFDFPTTLQTITAYVDHRAGKEGLSEKAKAAIGKEFIGKFQGFLEGEFGLKDLAQYVFFTDDEHVPYPIPSAPGGTSRRPRAIEALGSRLRGRRTR